jgi:hypothetical protein
LLSLPAIPRPQGALTPVEGGADVPFEIARVYYLYDVPGGAQRGGHAHKQLQQLLVSVMGAFDVVLDDGRRRTTVRLDRAYRGLYVPPMIWRELENFSSGAICLALASLPFAEEDYIREHAEFLRQKSRS